jgi:hypothetical protein
MLALPYMGGYPQKVVGPFSTQPTLFGVIGRFKESNKTQTLQTLVSKPGTGKIPGTMSEKSATQSMRGLLGPAAKTHIPGLHHGMVPFAGRFMSHVGEHGEHHAPHTQHYHSEKGI